MFNAHYSYLLPASAAFWLGGLIAIDFIETPTKFRIAGISRSAAVDLGQEVFRKFGYLEIVLSILLLGAAYFQSHGYIQSCLVLLAGILASGVSPWLRNVLVNIVKQDRESIAVNETTSKNSMLKKYHLLYVGCDILKMLILSSILFGFAWN